MKFVCLGCLDEARWEQFSPQEQEEMVQKCLEYDKELARGGHFVQGFALMPQNHAVTLRTQNGRVMTTDGPFAETKEYLGGILILEARDLNHAIQLMSLHPGVRMGSFEIRPLNEEFSAMIASEISLAANE
jgi:hypothetical protein